MRADSRTPQHNPPGRAPPVFPPGSAPPPFVADQPIQPSQHLPHYPQTDPRNRIPTGNQPSPSSDPYQRRPQPTYANPQEPGGTSQYPSAAEARPQSYSPPPQHGHPHQATPPDDDYTSSLFAATNGDPSHSQPPQQKQQQYHPYNPVNTYDQQQHAPPHQTAPEAPSPNLGQTPYPVLNSAPPASGGYQPCHAPPSRPQHQQGYAADAGGNPNDFYR